MKIIKKYWKILIGFIFVLLSISCANNQEYAGKVNKHLIKNTDYMIIVKNEYESFFLERNSSPSVPEQRMIEEKAWKRLTDGLVLKDIYEKYQISVSSKELLDTLKFHIPEIIKTSPQFITSKGEFDYAAYESSLMTNKPTDLSWLKNYYYTSYIPLTKLREYALNHRTISNNEIKKYYISQNNTIDGYAIIFNHKDFLNKSEVNAREIDEYYQKHITDYEITSSCHLKWVKFPIVPDFSDSLRAKEKADSLYKLVSNGHTFSTIAGNYSDGEYCNKKGYAGFMDLNIFPDGIRNQLDNASIGEILPPFYMNGSYYIFNIIEKTVSMVKLMVIQVDIKPTKETQERIKNDIKKFRELCNSIGFTNAVNEFRYQLFEKDSLSIKNTILPDFGASDNIVRKALRTPTGVVFEPIKNDKLNTYIVFYVFKNTPRSFKPLENVSEYIIDQIKIEKAKNLALNYANEFNKKYSNNLLKQANTDNLEIVYLKDFKIDSKINNQSYSQFNLELLSSENKGSIVVQEQNCSILGIIEKLHPINMDLLNVQKSSIKQTLQQINHDDFFKEFLEKEKSKATIKDYRIKQK